MRPHIQFLGVSKHYDKTIIDNFNLDIKQQEFLTILGPSGAGKSTILMMLAGFTDLDAGDILINEQSITKIPAHKRNIGMVFQNYALFPHMTIAQNLAYPLQFKAYNKGKIAKKIIQMLDLVQLADLKSRYPHQLSGGQKQRIALARALIYSPDIVLMDEPLGALDKNLRDHMQYEIKRLHQLLKFTTVYVTHDQQEALTMSDRILVLNEAKTQQLSDTKTLYHHPNNAFVAGFIGQNNKLVGKILIHQSQAIQVEVDGQLLITSDEKKQKNTNVSVFIRPENIQLSPPDNPSIFNQLTINIENIIFVGDYYSIFAKITKGQSLTIKHQGELPKTIACNQTIICYFEHKHTMLLEDHCIESVNEV